MAKKKQADEVVTVALLDERDFYQGVQTILKSQITKNDVEVPAECDLPIGRYYWDRERKTFRPDADLARAAIKARLQRKTRGN